MDKIVYLLPLLGNNINAARVPIIDTLAVGAALNNGFVDGDFSESVGLTNNDSPKYLNSQIKPSQLGVSNNGGLGWWETNIGFGTGVEPIGCYGGLAFWQGRFVLDFRTTVESFRWGDSANAATRLASASNGHYYGQRSSPIIRVLYNNGMLIASGNNVSDTTASETQIFIHGCNGSPTSYWSGTCAVAYMTDGTLSDAQVIELNTILHDNLMVPTGR